MSLIFPNSSHHIPDEIVLLVFSYCNPLQLSAVSKEWKRVANDEITWKNIWEVIMIRKFKGYEIPFSSCIEKYLGRISQYQIHRKANDTNPIIWISELGNDLLKSREEDYRRLSLITINEDKEKYERASQVVKVALLGGTEQIASLDLKLNKQSTPLPEAYSLRDSIIRLPESSIEEILKEIQKVLDINAIFSLENLSARKILKLYHALDTDSLPLVPPEEKTPVLLGKTLIFSSFSNDIEHVELILNEMIKNPLGDFYGMGAALLFAASRGYGEIVQKLLSYQEIIDLLPGDDPFGLGDALLVACQFGKIDVIQVLLSLPQVIDKIPGDGLNSFGHALREVVIWKDPEILTLFLSHPDVVVKISGDGEFGFGAMVKIALEQRKNPLSETILANQDILEKIPKTGPFGLIALRTLAIQKGQTTVDKRIRSVLPPIWKIFSWAHAKLSS